MGFLPSTSDYEVLTSHGANHDGSRGERKRRTVREPRATEPRAEPSQERTIYLGVFLS